MIEIDTENLLNIVNVEIPEKMKIQNTIWQLSVAFAYRSSAC